MQAPVLRFLCVACLATATKQGSTLFSLLSPLFSQLVHMACCPAQFDRERIPERVVHARGASAKGFFEVGTAGYCSCQGLVVLREGRAVAPHAAVQACQLAWEARSSRD